MLSFHGCPVARLGERESGGMNVYVLQLAREFARSGHKVDVYTRCHDPRDPEIVDLGDGARVIHLNAGPCHQTKETLYEYIPEFVSNLHAFQRSEDIRYDLVHSNYWLSGRVGVILGRQWGIPHVATFHTLAKTKLMARAGEREPESRVSVEELVVGSADAIAVCSQQEKEDLVRLYRAHRHKVRVVPAGVDVDLFRPMNKSRAKSVLGLEAKKVILYVGRIEPLKGIDLLLRSVALLEDAADTRLLIVGGRPGEDPELERLNSVAVQLGIADKVTFAGAVKQTELPAYYCAADVFVLPSYHESFGLAALEAMACGTPVIVSRVGGLKTFIREGETGYLIPWHCPEPFAQRLDMLLANSGLRRTLGRAARAKAEQMTWGKVADRVLDLYSYLLGDTLESATGA